MKKTNQYPIILFLTLAWAVLTSCSSEKKTSLPGYVQGKFTYISAYYAGIVEKISVNPGDTIKEGQALFTLGPNPESAELQAADARVQQAINEQNQREASYILQKANNERNLLLFKKGVISKEELDKSIEDFRTATASKKAADANLAAEQANQSKATWASQQKTVSAPMDALVFETYYSEHEKVGEGQPVLSLLTPGSIKIIFYIPEQLLSTLKLNQKISFFIDGIARPMQAKITYISPKEEYTPPVIFSETERQRLVFRIEAHPIATDSFLKIHPGQPITVRLDTNNS